MIKRPISNILLSNIQKDDLSLYLSLLFNAREQGEGKILAYNEKTSQNGSFWPNNTDFNAIFSFNHLFSLNAGRSAFLAILECLELEKKSEIIIQAFTCTALASPIIKAGFKPIYADIDDNLNIDPQSLEEKITDKTKAVVVQHTFGYPAQIEKIQEICKKYNLLLIEDCAHCIGIKYKDKYLGQFGDISFFSFGRDKIITAGYGGMIGTNSDLIAQRLKNYISNLDYPDKFWTFKQILHPILINYFVLPFYNFGFIGKAFGKLFLILNLTSKSVYKKEKEGKWVNYFPKKMPGALKILANNQLQKIEQFQTHRREICEFYIKNIPNGFSLVFKNEKDIQTSFMRFPILINNPDKKEKLLSCLEKKGIYLYDGWSDSVILPPDSNQEKFLYKKGSCPKAENLAQKIINLPTHINLSAQDAQYLITAIQQCK